MESIIKGMESLGKSVEENKMLIDSMSGKAGAEKNKYADSIAKFQKIADDVLIIQKELSKIKEKLHDSENIKGIIGDISALKSGISECAKSTGIIASENADLTDRIKRLEEKPNALPDLEKRIRQDIADAIGRAPVKKDYSALKKDFEEIEKSILLLRQEMDSGRQEHPEKLAKLETDIRHLAEEICEIKKTLPEQDEKIKTLLERIDSYKKSAEQSRRLAGWQAGKIPHAWKGNDANRNNADEDAPIKKEIDELEAAFESMKSPARLSPAPQSIPKDVLPRINTGEWAYDTRNHAHSSRADIGDLMRRIDDVRRKSAE